MDKKQINIIFRIVILLFLISLSSTGCSTLQKESPPLIKQEDTFKTQKQVVEFEAGVKKSKSKITDDVLFFRDLQEVDLYKNGEKEIVAICVLKDAPMGVKVIKPNSEGGEILFERSFNTPDVKFITDEDIPTIIFEEIDPSTGRHFRRNYRWDGRTFILQENRIR